MATLTEIQNPFRMPLSAEEMQDLPRLFEEFSRTTANLVATHGALCAEVESLKQELADKSRRLERKKRLEALGRVAAGMAHEFRNPLGGIRLTVDALLEAQPHPRARERLEHVRRAVEHLNHIVEDLLTFTLQGVVDRIPIPCRDLVEHSLAMAFGERSWQAQGIRVQGDPELEVAVDRHGFTQVLVNLLLNASQALADGTGPETPADRLGVWWGERDGRVWIEVADDGPGIPAGEEEKIFHPFYSLRDGGTGLGLAIVHSRVEAHEGEIAVVDEAWGGCPGFSGARFRIQLPVAVPAAPVAEPEE